MINYNRLSYQIKRNLSTFSNKISKDISRPKSKFIFQMMYGFLESNSILLSNIARKKESILVLLILKISKRIYDIPEFDYYALADGIYTILQKTKTGIKSFIKSRSRKRKSQQLTIADAFV